MGRRIHAAILVVLFGAGHALALQPPRKTQNCNMRGNIAQIVVDGPADLLRELERRLQSRSDRELFEALWRPVASLTNLAYSPKLTLQYHPLLDRREIAREARAWLLPLGVRSVWVDDAVGCVGTLPPDYKTTMEYHHAGREHYRLAGSAQDRHRILSEDGWREMGPAFIQDRVAPLCLGTWALGVRFERVESPGRNEVVTADAEECGILWRSGDWSFAGYSFLVTGREARPPRPACNSYYQSVFRLFNNKPSDPNHRHTMDPLIVEQMVERGWILEGTAFCAIRPDG